MEATTRGSARSVLVRAVFKKVRVRVPELSKIGHGNRGFVGPGRCAPFESRFSLLLPYRTLPSLVASGTSSSPGTGRWLSVASFPQQVGKHVRRTRIPKGSGTHRTDRSLMSFFCVRADSDGLEFGKPPSPFSASRFLWRRMRRSQLQRKRLAVGKVQIRIRQQCLGVRCIRRKGTGPFFWLHTLPRYRPQPCSCHVGSRWHTI